MKNILALFLLIILLAVGISAVSTRSFAHEDEQDNGNLCETSCPSVHFEWGTKVYDDCLSGYHVRNGHNDQCQKDGSTGNHDVVDRPSHQDNHSVDVQYNKSQDPHKCHRPSDDDLGDIYGMNNSVKNDFKDAHPEFLDSIVVVPDGYHEDGGYCYPNEQEHHYSCEDNACVIVNGAGQDSCSPNDENSCSEEVTPTVTPTPTNSPSNPGGPGDGRSDGLSSCPECTQAPQGQVLGATTQAVLGLSTTSGEGNIYLTLVQLVSALGLAGTGLKLFRKHG